MAVTAYATPQVLTFSISTTTGSIVVNTTASNVMLLFGFWASSKDFASLSMSNGMVTTSAGSYSDGIGSLMWRYAYATSSLTNVTATFRANNTGGTGQGRAWIGTFLGAGTSVNSGSNSISNASLTGTYTPTTTGGMVFSMGAGAYTTAPSMVAFLNNTLLSTNTGMNDTTNLEFASAVQYTGTITSGSSVTTGFSGTTGCFGTMLKVEIPAASLASPNHRMMLMGVGG